jgi:GTP cyclohydrolase I
MSNSIEELTKTLPDVQNSQDPRGIGLERVGLTNIKFPIIILRKDGSQVNASAKVKLFASLPESAKGHNLSRFMEVLVFFKDNHSSILNFQILEDILVDMQRRLGSKDVYARFEFDYYINKKAPVSKKIAPMSYLCAMTGIKKNGNTYFLLEVNVVAASVCPCSKEMSLLQNDYIINEISAECKCSKDIEFYKDIGRFVGLGAHNQRSLIKIEIQVDKDDGLYIEDLIKSIEAQASAPTFPLLKRADERWVTEKGYKNPKFSEDIARDLQIMLQNNPKVLAWSLKVENEESIHPFNVLSSSKSVNWIFY